MIVKSKSILCIPLIYIIGICSAQEEATHFHVLKGPYLGQKLPGSRPEVFASDIISTEKHAEYDGHFSPDGREFYFTRYSYGNSAKLWATELRGGFWTKPRVLSFMETFPGAESCISPDGKK